MTMHKLLAASSLRTRRARPSHLLRYPTLSGILAPLLVFCLLFVTCSATVRGAEPGEHHLTLLVTSGLSGRLVDENGQNAAMLAATVRQLAGSAEAKGHGVVVLDAGRALVPYAESRFDTGATMGAVLAAAGCQVFVPDPLDLGLRASNSADPAVLGVAAANPFATLRGFSIDRGPLGVLEEAAAVSPLPDLPVVIVGLLDPAFYDDLSVRGQTIGALDLDSVLQRADPDHHALRIAISHSWSEDGELTGRRSTWDLVEGNSGLDLVIDPDFGQDLVIERLGKEGSLFLVGRHSDSRDRWSVAEIQLTLRALGKRWAPVSSSLRIHPADPSLPTDPALHRQIGETLAAFNRDSQIRFPEPAPGSREELERFILQAIAELTESEVVVLNRGALRPVAEALFDSGPPTRELIRRLLSIDQWLEVGELKGSELKTLAQQSLQRVDASGALRKSSLEFQGLSYKLDGSTPPKAKSFTINGRQVYDDDLYRVATNTYLGRGGDNYEILTSLDGEVWRLDDGRPLEVRDDLVFPRLERAGDGFVDPGARGLWRYGVDKLSIAFEGIDTTADPAYQGVADSRANAENSSTLRSSLRLYGDQEWGHFSWENHLRSRFALVDDTGGSVSEVEDDLRLESSGVFTQARWLGARPFGSLILDTELRANTDGAGNTLPRQLELNLVGGLRWQLPHWPAIRFGWQSRRQSDVDRANLLGAFAEAKWDWPLGLKGPRLSGRIFTEHMVDSGTELQRLDFELQLDFTLTDHLSLTPSFNLYLYNDSRLPGTAEYRRFSIGLTYSWSGKYQRL